MTKCQKLGSVWFQDALNETDKPSENATLSSNGNVNTHRVQKLSRKRGEACHDDCVHFWRTLNPSAPCSFARPRRLPHARPISLSPTSDQSAAALIGLNDLLCPSRLCNDIADARERERARDSIGLMGGQTRVPRVS